MAGWPNLSDLLVAGARDAPVGLVGAPLGGGFGDARAVRPGAGAASADAPAHRPLRCRDRRELVDANRRPRRCRDRRPRIEQATPLHPRGGRGERRAPRADPAGRRQQCGHPAGVLGLGVPLDKVGLITLDAHFDMRDTRSGPEQRQSGARADRGWPARREHRAGRPRELRQQPRRCTRMRSPPAIWSSPSAKCAATGIALAIDRALDHVAHCDAIVVDCDIDVIDRSQFPGRAGRAARRNGGRTISSPRCAGSRPTRGCASSTSPNGTRRSIRPTSAL